MEAKLREAVWSLPVIQKAHIYEPKIEDVAEISFKAGIKEVGEALLSDDSIEIGRKAIEDTLIEWRENRLSTFNRGNGLVVREKDGGASDIIRFGPETALRIGIKAILKAAKEVT